MMLTFSSSLIQVPRFAVETFWVFRFSKKKRRNTFASSSVLCFPLFCPSAQVQKNTTSRRATTWIKTVSLRWSITR